MRTSVCQEPGCGVIFKLDDDESTSTTPRCEDCRLNYVTFWTEDGLIEMKIVREFHAA